MCGIFGYYNYIAKDAPLNKEECVRLTDLMAHRGPDGKGLYYGHNVALGHRRLSIIDLSAAAGQPFSLPGGGAYIVFNGEIYNFKELKSELEGLGRKFIT